MGGTLTLRCQNGRHIHPKILQSIKFSVTRLPPPSPPHLLIGLVLLSLGFTDPTIDV